MPEQILGRIIRACSNKGEIVLDPFGGSGTTLVTAKKLERRFLGFELSKNYAAQIEKRLAAVHPGDPLSNTDSSPMVAPPTPVDPKAPRLRVKVIDTAAPREAKKRGRPPKNRNGEHINGENRLFAL
jgi:site-specific DNA-methyltransferase (adenine-specific)